MRAYSHTILRPFLQFPLHALFEGSDKAVADDVAGSVHEGPDAWHYPGSNRGVDLIVLRLIVSSEGAFVSNKDDVVSIDEAAIVVKPRFHITRKVAPMLPKERSILLHIQFLSDVPHTKVLKPRNLVGNDGLVLLLISEPPVQVFVFFPGSNLSYLNPLNPFDSL